MLVYYFNIELWKSNRISFNCIEYKSKSEDQRVFLKIKRTLLFRSCVCIRLWLYFSLKNFHSDISPRCWEPAKEILPHDQKHSWAKPFYLGKNIVSYISIPRKYCNKKYTSRIPFLTYYLNWGDRFMSIVSLVIISYSHGLHSYCLGHICIRL